MAELQKSVSDSQMGQMTQMAALGTKQKNDARNAGLAAKQLEFEKDKLSVSEEQSSLDRNLARETQALNAIEGERSRVFQDHLVTKQIGARKDQAALESNLREGILKREQERGFRIDIARRKSDLEAMDIDDDDILNDLEAEKRSLEDHQMSRMEAEALAQGKHKEFKKAKNKLRMH